jgi:ribonucleoside-diphosphate reductase alpha chain
LLQFTHPLQESIFNERYAFYPGESWAQASQRVAEHIARNERDFIRWSDVFYRQISDGKFMPGGRIWYGSGRPTGQLLNCFVIPTEDSREGWARSVGENIIIAGTGGGVGANYSPIRPRGTEIKGTGGYATGAVSLMRIENAALTEIKDGGGRRAARMMCLNINHPDIEEFLSAKLDKNQLNNANVSVVFNEDPEIFFNAVRENKGWDLLWQGKIVRTVPAKDLWHKIVSNALQGGEPGILNMHLANQMNNIYYCRELVSTNPCGEICMQPYSTCCLVAVVLTSFIKQGSKAIDVRNRIDWEGLHETVSAGVRFLDNVLDVTYYPTVELKNESAATRSIGLGIMGLHYFLLQLGLKYSSQEGRDIVEKVMTFIKHSAYDASIHLAIEKGVFPEYNAEKIMDSGFIQGLKPSMRSKIRASGIRNCAILTIAPTGTTSMAIGVSSGIEPITAMGYQRSRYLHDGERISEPVIDYLLSDYLTKGLDCSGFEDASTISIRDHFLMQEVCQRHIDNAVSKTINILPGALTEQGLSDLYMEFVPKLKGVTIYPEGSREGEPIQRMTSDQLTEALNTASLSSAGLLDCPTGTCEI